MGTWRRGEHGLLALELRRVFVVEQRDTDVNVVAAPRLERCQRWAVKEGAGRLQPKQRWMLNDDCTH